VWFQATLTWRPGEEMPAGPILGVPTPEAKFCSLARTDDASSATCRISCEIRAFYAEELTDALDRTLRSVTAYAGFTEAILETRAVRLADPSVSPSTLVEKLARQLWSANLPVSFGSSWTPLAGADISVGTWAFEDAFETVLRAHPVWQPPLRLG
jgi:hypothetical protein